jgi:integrase
MSGKRRDKGEGSVYATDGKWREFLDLGYVGGQRKRKYFSGKTKRDVLDKLNAARRALGRAQVLPDDRQTVEQFLASWLQMVRQAKRARTYEAYDLQVRRLLPHLGRLRLSQLTPAAIQKAYAALLEKGLKGKPLSRRSVKHAHAALHTALEQALKWELIYRNPTDVVEVPQPPKREMATLGAEQAGHLFASAASQEDPLQALWIVFATTGPRMGEACALRWADLDLACGTAVIQRALQRQRGVGLVFVEPKSDSSRRTVQLARFAVAALKEHRKRQAEWRLSLGSEWHDHDLVFCSQFGKPLDPARVRDRFHRALDCADLPNLRPHDLRHTAATLLLKRGVHPKVVQELLGHSSITLTLGTYSHTTPAMHAEAARQMDVLFGGANPSDEMQPLQPKVQPNPRRRTE